MAEIILLFTLLLEQKLFSSPHFFWGRNDSALHTSSGAEIILLSALLLGQKLFCSLPFFRGRNYSALHTYSGAEIILLSTLLEYTQISLRHVLVLFVPCIVC
jgi:hypothetical protein